MRTNHSPMPTTPGLSSPLRTTTLIDYSLGSPKDSDGNEYVEDTPKRLHQYKTCKTCPNKVKYLEQCIPCLKGIADEQQARIAWPPPKSRQPSQTGGSSGRACNWHCNYIIIDNIFFCPSTDNPSSAPRGGPRSKGDTSATTDSVYSRPFLQVRMP